MPSPNKVARAWWADWNQKNQKNPTDIIDIKTMEKVRERCYTDHAFLAKCLGYKGFEPEVHDEVWKFFVQKDPTIVEFEDFARADKLTHDRALFLPRNGYKSTANMVDITQFIICWPNITILLVTAKADIGRDFIQEVTAHFKRQEDGNPKIIDGEYSLFQLAFPEFCVDSKVPRDSFTVPCRTGVNIKEDTISFAGVEISMSGPHFSMVIFDDAISNENSNTASRLLAIRNQIGYHRKTMNPWGYCTYIGTWYNPLDHYGFLIRAEEENKTLFWHKGKADSRDVEGRQCMTKIMLRPAMWEKGDKQIDIDGSVDEKDWELWFPSRIDWKWLMKERAGNRELFHSQLMNNPNLTKSVRFNRNTMTAQTRVFTEIPDVHSGQGLLVQSWDTAYTDSTLSNYTVGLTLLILGGRFYVIDMKRGQFSDFEIARVMAEHMAKWRPHRVVLEESNGVHWLAREMRREMERLNFYVGLEFAQIENKKNRKSILAAPVAKMFSEGRILISNAVPSLDHFYTELEGFQNGAPNDDIVDALSIGVNYFQFAPEASVAALRANVGEEQQRRHSRMLYNHYFGLSTGDSGFADQSQQRSGEELPSWVTYSPSDAFR